MKKVTLLLIFIATTTLTRVLAQPGIPVTDQQPQIIEGLKCGYIIKSLETKEVGDKGNFSRYSVNFYVTNVTDMPRIFYFRRGTNGINGVSDLLVQFNCLNATGARLTSKSVVIHATPHQEFHERDRRQEQVGYSIMPGQTINTEAIIIVPLNQQLNIVAYYLGYSQQQVPWSSDGNAVVNTQGDVPPPPPILNTQGFTQIRNLYSNTFINIQTGVVGATPIQNGWWSAQWQIIPVPGTNFYKIQNHWKSNFMCTENGYLTMTPSDQPDGSNWIFEPSERGGNIFRIKNVRSGAYISVVENHIALSAGMDNNPGLLWAVQ
jgi:hypothetical protein